MKRANDPERFILESLTKRLNLDDENEKLEELETMRAKTEKLRKELEALKKNAQEKSAQRQKFNVSSNKFANPYHDDDE